MTFKRPAFDDAAFVRVVASPAFSLEGEGC